MGCLPHHLTHLLSMSSSLYTTSAPYSAASILVGIVFTRTMGARIFLPRKNSPASIGQEENSSLSVECFPTTTDDR